MRSLHRPIAASWSSRWRRPSASRAASSGDTRSGPTRPGALVIANGEPIGTTPVSKSFTFYGDRTFRIIKEGYETKDSSPNSRPPGTTTI